MPKLPSKEKLRMWALVVVIVITAWGVNIALSLEAIHYACQAGASECDIVTMVALGWIVVQRWFSAIFAGFIVGKVTGTRILR